MSPKDYQFTIEDKEHCREFIIQHLRDGSFNIEVWQYRDHLNQNFVSMTANKEKISELRQWIDKEEAKDG